MKALATILLGALLLGTPAAAQDKTLEKFGWFADLVGACWTGDSVAQRLRDTQCYAKEYDGIIVGAIEFMTLAEKPARRMFGGKAVYGWDDKKQRIKLAYWAEGGSFGAGEGWYEGPQKETLVFTNYPRAEVPENGLRTRWTRVDADTFRVVREAQEGGEWKVRATVEYKRVPAAK